MSGYTSCSCRDCFEIGIDGACWECEDAGCDLEGNSECSVERDDIEEAADASNRDMAAMVASGEAEKFRGAMAASTCEDNGGDDSNHCHECLECLARLESELKRAARSADRCDESDRMATILSEQVADLKRLLGR